MSYTELFGLTRNSVIGIGETANAWRGAMAVWIILEKKYLTPFVPQWAVEMGEQDKEHSRTAALNFDNKGPSPIKEIWDLVDSPRLSETEKIVLCSTFDNVLAKVESIGRVLSAFRKFEGETSLGEQADIMETAVRENPEIVAIGWNHTSVNGDTWANETCDDDGEPVGYNLETGKRHWFLIEELENLKKKE